jgi:hypothetical protein
VKRSPRAKDAAPESGKYVKNLVDPSALKEVRVAVQNMRDRHKELTRPWDDDGRRLIPAGLMPVYEQDMAAHIGKFNDAVDAFVREYPGLRDYAEMQLGQLFDPNDYPCEQDIIWKFEAAVEYEPVPDGSYAPPGYEEKVEQAVKRRMRESADGLFYRVVNALTEVNRKLKAHDERVQNDDKRGRFRLTILDELKELSELLPALNIENDPFLNGVHERMKKELITSIAKPEVLRDSDGSRKSYIAKVDALLTDMSKRG